MDLEQLNINPEFLEFHQKLTALMDASNHSGACIGFNFKGETITSIKLYYVFFEKFDLKKPFPIPELKEKYMRLISKASKNINDISSPGCGLTFAIKFDSNLNSTKGLFFRIDDDNSRLTDNIVLNYPEINFKKDDFENGYGVFLTTKENTVSENNYIYLKNTQLLKSWETKYDIDFSNAGTIEINNANSPKRDQKFLLIHEKTKISNQFYSKIPKVIRKSIENWDVNVWCPAINPSTDSYSIYLFSEPVVHSTENNFISTFFKRVKENSIT